MQGASIQDTGPVMRFFYHKAVAPLIWVLFALSTIELLVVHFLLSFWNIWAAYIATALTLVSMLWLVHFLLSMPKRPVLLTPDQLVMRVGTALQFSIDRSNISGLRESWSSDDLKVPGLANLGLLAYPNVIIDLKEPHVAKGMFGEKRTTAIAHRLDNVSAFIEAMKQEENEIHD